MLDTEIDNIYKDKKNDYLKLFVLKNGNYAVYYYGANIFESHSKRISMIEFILQCAIKKLDKGSYDNMDYNNVDYLKNLFGFN